MGLTQTARPTVGGSRNQWGELLESASAVLDGYLPATNSAAGIIEAAESAAADGAMLTLRGEYETGTTTVTLACNLDARAATISASASAAPAIRVGTATSGGVVEHIEAHLPQVICTKSGSAGVWGAGVGVEISNLYRAKVIAPFIQNFGTNLKMTAVGQGTVFVDVFAHLYNGKVNLDLSPGTGGWTNSNRIWGSCHINSGEGSNISGARHIVLREHANPVNNNIFEMSIEGNGPEYHVSCGGSYNDFRWMRWEASPPKVLLTGTSAHSNLFDRGYTASLIQFTLSGGAAATYNELLTREFHTKFGSSTEGVYRASNNYSANSGVFTVLGATADFSTDPATSYAFSAGQNTVKGKGVGDASPKWSISNTSGNIRTSGNLGVGNSAAATTPGSVVKKIEVFDAAGVSLGYVAVYDTIS